MRNIRKSSTLESKFPLLAVEQGCIISKDGDITVAYEVTLPEIFTVTSQEYESVHAAWCKAIKVLPDYSIVHKQDWFVKENYAPDMQNSDMSFLSRSYERHFNERPYLHHQCYLFLTKTTKERMAHQSNFSTLCRGHIIPKEIKDKETVARFLDAVEQFARIINDSGYISLRRLTDEEITGTERTTGLVGKYLSLSTENVQYLEDMELSASGMRIGNKHLCLHTLSQTEDLPTEVSTDNRFERLSTDRSDCRLSFAAPVGLLLSCNHIYNQYVFIDNSDETLQKFEKTARNMHSLSRYSRQNAINKEWIDEYLNEAHSQGLQSVRAHFNVLAWGEDMEELKHLRNDVGSQLASMECVPRHNTVDCPTLFWAAIPGNEGDVRHVREIANPAPRREPSQKAVVTLPAVRGPSVLPHLGPLPAPLQKRPTLPLHPRHPIRDGHDIHHPLLHHLIQHAQHVPAHPLQHPVQHLSVPPASPHDRHATRHGPASPL